ncbi:AAA family ATPase (plasmid) [Rhizobium leguminosarum]
MQAQSTAPSTRFVTDTNVFATLEGLFRSKCAFCESRVPLNIHLFRPEAEATPLAASDLSHLYYVWLRTDWGNHYLICEACSALSYRQFPVRKGRGRLPTPDEMDLFAKEDLGLWRWKHHDTPLLLDPCRERDFGKHLSPDLSGTLQDRSVAGRTTIDVFDLNRADLVSSRSSAFKQYLGLLRSEFDRNIASTISDFEQMEHGGTWYLLLKRLAGEVSRRIEKNVRTERGNLIDALREACNTEIGSKAFDEAVEAMHLPAPPNLKSSPRVRRAKAGPLVAVEVRNFKSLEHLELTLPPAIAGIGRDGVPEASSLLILGENATGKSSLLEGVAIALAGEKVRSSLTKAPRNFVLNPEMMGAGAAAAPEQSTVELSFEGSTKRTLNIRQDFTEEGDELKLPTVFAYGAFRHYGQSIRRARRFGHVGTLFQQDIVLPNPEAWLLDLDDNRFGMVARALRQILSIEGDYGYIEKDLANRRCLVVTRVGEEAVDPLKTPLALVSSGYRSVLAMVCDIFEGAISKSDKDLVPLDEIDAVILIDEIEAHLHPKWKMQIMGSLRRVFPKATIIATTHDPLCIRGMHEGEVVVLSRLRNEGSDHEMPSFVQIWTELPNVETMTIEQLLTSDLFAMFSTDSPAAERKLAELGTLLSRREGGGILEEDEDEVLKQLEKEVSLALPLGTTQVQRLVLKAVADYLDKRKGASIKQLQSLEDAARQNILRALEGI